MTANDIRGRVVNSPNCNSAISTSVPKMRFIFTSALLASSAFAFVVPRDNEKVDYSGFKLLRLENIEGLEAQIDELSAHVLNPGKSAQLDVVVSPDNVDAITALAKSKVINDDVGAILAEEGEMGVYAGKFGFPVTVNSN